MNEGMNAWMNGVSSADAQEVSSTVQWRHGESGGGGGGRHVIWMDLNVLQRVIKTSYLHHFCSTGTGSARRSPAPRRTPHRTSWSPSVWSTSLARVCPASSPPPPTTWLQWRLIWARRWGSHWLLDARFHWEWDDPSSPPPGPCSGRSSLRQERTSPSLV